MKVETMGPLVDLKDLYQALAEVRSDNLPKESRAYLLFKIRETCQSLQATAKFVKRRIDALDPPSPLKGKPRLRYVCKKCKMLLGTADAHHSPCGSGHGKLIRRARPKASG